MREGEKERRREGITVVRRRMNETGSESESESERGFVKDLRVAVAAAKFVEVRSNERNERKTIVALRCV
ncbi:uncharacterized protein DS421_5g157670 [Arachis hypogaea]|nr:uncharacterized protein DS421_5g157670 [Arachis hypogaea]